MDNVIREIQDQDRLKHVEDLIEGLQDRQLQMKIELSANVERFKRLEEINKLHEEEWCGLKEAAQGLQKQVDQLAPKLNTLEMKLFSYLQQIQKDSSKERQSSQKEWMRFLQIVLGGTIFLIVAYIFSVDYQG
ncbi:hypothetical protein ACFPYJ_27625 [Paenibacillus solisilvae]|uniref:Uncharacterized protein n=1 Tax=Paenibacillus solisilvae TaxID=2486751 RepID=A0ABW0W6W4_9BACL